MTRRPASGPVALVSRLRWDASAPQDVDAAGIEVPHVRGVPIVDDELLASTPDRRRSWPNRAGILEQGSPADVVDWQTELAPDPGEGRIVRHGGPTPSDFIERLAWFRRFLKSLVQVGGVSVPVEPEGLCGIVMTRGVGGDRIAAAQALHPGSLMLLPRRLGEFPGGLQLKLTGEAWAQPEAYAGAVRDVLNGKG